MRRPAGILAKGKDPNFEPWSDVVQLNAFSPSLRRAVADTLISISDKCDGVRCDMAMLMMNEVFAGTWGKRAGAVPRADYWPAIIGAVRAHNPDFRFIAEVYWGKEPALLGQGFDFCYDKNLYDYLVEGSARSLKSIKRWLKHDPQYQQHLLRFIENHDEPRAAAAFPLDRHMAAAVIMATSEGAHLFHQGQLDGWRIRVPVHLARGPAEPVNVAVRTFYADLLAVSRLMNLPSGQWQLCKTVNYLRLEHKRLLAWHWQTGTGDFIVAVNYGVRKARGRLRLPKDLAGRGSELLANKADHVDVNKLLRGRSVTFNPWQYIIVQVHP